jgi:hypothetical protein
MDYELTMKILDVRWFNSVGIVRVEDPYEGIKYYIKQLDEDLELFGTEEQGMKYIADWGNTFPKDAGDVLFGVKYV